jgi:hypothetical protein
MVPPKFRVGHACEGFQPVTLIKERASALQIPLSPTRTSRLGAHQIRA